MSREEFTFYSSVEVYNSFSPLYLSFWATEDDLGNGVQDQQLEQSSPSTDVTEPNQSPTGNAGSIAILFLLPLQLDITFIITGRKPLLYCELTAKVHDKNENCELKETREKQ